MQVKNPDKEIWEGWTVADFVERLDIVFESIEQRGYHISVGDMNTRKDVAKWCKDEMPYIKKHIPEVVDYFESKMKVVRKNYWYRSE